MKLKLGDQLVDSLTQEIHGLHSEIKLADSINFLNALSITLLLESNDRKDSVNAVVVKNFDKMVEARERERKNIFKQPVTYIGLYLLIEAIKLIF